MVPIENRPPNSGQPWRLTRALLYGFLVGILVELLHWKEIAAEASALPVGSFVGDLIGRLAAAPLVFVAIAAIRNLVVRNKNSS